MQVQLSNQTSITVAPPSGGKLVRAQLWFGARFAYLQALPPKDEQAQRKAVQRITRALMPYVRGATHEQLLDAFMANPYDMVLVAQSALGAQAQLGRGKARR